ncbi:MAG: putative membrane protein, partial [Gammaproteobacteria bacterium]
GLFAQHFNQGLRANFFALALLGWWLNTWFFIASIAIVLWVIYRREFRSQSLIIANKLMLLTDPQVESDIQMQQKAKLTDVNAAGETKNLNLSTT